MEDTIRIEIHDIKDGQSWEDYIAEALATGHAAQGYTCDEKKYASGWLDNYPQADAYVCYRQGDIIIMLVPKGTPLNTLPKSAMCYWALAWENLRTGEVWSPVENRHFYKRIDPASGREVYFNTPE